MESVDKAEQQTQKGIADNLNQAGVKVTAEDVSAEHKFPLKDLEELGGEVINDTRNYAQTTAEELTSGEDIHKGDRVARRNPINLAWERVKKLKIAKK